MPNSPGAVQVSRGGGRFITGMQTKTATEKANVKAKANANASANAMPNSPGAVQVSRGGGGFIVLDAVALETTERTTAQTTAD
ncbi:hypothetical protein AURDEDRAFT_170220 [Auricularia subglabra TFB-10046 SS5]|nr:hypothetical protein AURDEDRAFT_170220 [Auricularia subglabra TFB-10046 SS5]